MSEITGVDEAVVFGLDEQTYHAHPSLSYSSMKRLLASPLQYQHYLANPETRDDFDFGSAVHADVLGVGGELAEIPDDLLSGANRSVSSTEAKEWVAAARERGEIPLKSRVIAEVKAAADAVRRNPKAAWLLDLPGQSEVSLFAKDPETDVSIRGRLDRMAQLPDGRLLNVDLKSASAKNMFCKLHWHIRDMDYDLQAATYEHLLALTDEAGEVAPTHLIFVQSEAPYEVRVVQLAHEDWREAGRLKLRRALSIYKACLETGEWPGRDDAPGAAEVLLPPPYYIDDLAMEATS